MEAIELTSSQEKILRTVIDLHTKLQTTVKGDDIADEVGLKAGTIRNKMQSLKALQLVEGFPGPKGGYKPTAAAYTALEIQQIDDPSAVTVKYDGEMVDNVIVEGISLSSVHHPDLCRAEIRMQGEVDNISEGDLLTVGPTPLSRLTVKGTVEQKDRASNIVTLQIEGMQTTESESPRVR
ncbi:MULTISPECIES: Rrf2 family transcriptional regulator [Natrialba]|uniref:Transcriptional regulator n=1 Tax=Natrialba taiwanensis DSM 12281 TaxID=1230458 RepID=M0A793_9EURY|nr:MULTISPECIES: Rrf2 family transcriptional regulator [Natrialba]ELY93762.1 transcriptional regulator [Natrialba taiwanensis DSM 12281]